MVEFKGSDYNEARDKKRLTAGMARVLAVIQDGRRRTVQEIKAEILERYGVEDLENSIQANVRNLRKKPNGKHSIPKAQRRADGLYEYHLVPDPRSVPVPPPAPAPSGGLFPTADDRPKYGMM